MADYKTKVIAILEKSADEYCTSSLLASELQVSKRTIINTIKAINANEQIIISTKKGYKLVKNLSKKQSINPEYPDERKDYIIWILLTNKDINIFDLADQLYVSSSTIKNDISDLKKDLLRKFNLTIIYKQDRISISGEEKDIRRLFDWRIRKESCDKFTTLNFLQVRFPNIDIVQIKVVIQSELQKQGVFINDFQLIAIILHLCIIIQRSETNNYITEKSNNHFSKNSSPEFIAAEKILMKIENIFPKCNFNDFEKNNFSLLIASNSTHSNADSILYEHIDSSIIALTDTIFEKVTENFGMNLISPSFKNRFMLHLSSLLFRCENNITSKNDLVLITKNKFPLIYEIATYIAYQIKVNTGYLINDEEISFIAFHIGNEIDEQLQKSSLIRCALVAYQYNQIDYHLANKITSLFGSKLIIVATDTSDKEAYEFADVDLIITVLPIITEQEYVIVHPLLSQEDIETLEKKIDKLINHKKNMQMRQSVSSLFKKEFFIKNSPIENEHQAITEICNIFFQKGYIDKDFVNSVFEREKLSSTAFGNYAIPHPLVVSAKKTAIFVLINEKPVKWNESNVNFIFLLCVSEQDKLMFKDLFSSLIYLLTDIKIKQKLVSVNNFDEFISIINDYI